MRRKEREGEHVALRNTQAHTYSHTPKEGEEET